MFIEIPIMAADEAARLARALEAAPWADGRATAGYQSALAKHNQQLPEDSAEARALGQEVVNALSQSLLFQSAAIPARIFPPLFNRYGPGDRFGTHVDNAIRTHASGMRIRTDLSATLFLSDPESYDGGELVIEDGGQERAVRLAAGHLLLYPATTLHAVRAVTRGVRLAAFFWVQSLVRDAGQRAILFDIDLAIQSLRKAAGDTDPAIIALTGAYHNLLRQWAEC